jgi:hypothetical protein
LSATTTAPDTPVTAGTVVDNVLPGTRTYTIVETLPTPTTAGSWTVDGFECTDGTVGNNPPTSPTQTVTLISGSAVDCTYTDLFTPIGSLTVTKTTLAGTGTTSFVVTPVVSNPDTDTTDTASALLTATTTQPGVAVTATQVAGAPLNPLAIGQYSIVEEGPGDTSAGLWTPVSIVCNGAQVEPSAADVLVSVTTTDPHVTCAFTNTFTANPPVIPTTTTTVPSGSGGTAAATTIPGGSSGGQLAATGSDVRMPLALAALLALLGVVMIGVDRVRRSRRAAAVPLRRYPPL